jgi:hypothetical protein
MGPNRNSGELGEGSSRTRLSSRRHLFGGYGSSSNATRFALDVIPRRQPGTVAGLFGSSESRKLSDGGYAAQISIGCVDMPQTPQFSITSVDLMSFSFNWEAPTEDSSGLTNTYTATTRGLSKKNEKSVYAMCEFSASRKGSTSSNFTISGKYFYAIELNEEPNQELIERAQKTIVAHVVWTRFLDSAKFAMVQAGIGDADIPITPEDVLITTREMA